VSLLSPLRPILRNGNPLLKFLGIAFTGERILQRPTPRHLWATGRPRMCYPTFQQLPWCPAHGHTGHVASPTKKPIVIQLLSQSIQAPTGVFPPNESAGVEAKATPIINELQAQGRIRSSGRLSKKKNPSSSGKNLKKMTAATALLCTTRREEAKKPEPTTYYRYR